MLLVVFETAGEETAAKDEKNVGEDGAEHGRLDDTNFAIFERNDADLQTRSAPVGRAKVALHTINSTAFPNVALRRPPSVCPSLADNSSVAKLRSEASGMMARKFSMKMTVGLHPTAPETMPKGTKINSTLT